MVQLDPWGDVWSDGLLISTDGAAFGEISDLDVARTRDSILVTLHYPTEMRIVEYPDGKFYDGSRSDRFMELVWRPSARFRCLRC